MKNTNNHFQNGILRHESKTGKITFKLFGIFLLDREEGQKLFYGTITDQNGYWNYR